MQELLKELSQIEDDNELEIAWSVLRRKDQKCGILKKLKMLAYLMDVDEAAVIEGAEKDESGRILDKPNRDAIAAALQG